MNKKENVNVKSFLLLPFPSTSIIDQYIVKFGFRILDSLSFFTPNSFLYVLLIF